MKRNLDALKSAFTKKTDDSGNADWKLFYSFWKMPVDSVAVVRFLPDLDEENSLGFLVENLQHELIVNGERKRVPCLTMYGEQCPCCDLARKYYDDEDKENGKKFYKKRSYIGQIIVVESPIEHDQAQLNKLVEFGPQVFKQIQAAFQSGDLEEAPFELKGGYNFRFRKTLTGQGQNSYTTSNFAPKQTDLDDDLIDSLTLFDLKEYRTKYMDRAVIEAMLVAAQTGEAFNSGSNGNDGDGDGDNDVPSAPAPAAKKEAAKAETPKAESSGEASSGKAQSVLERLRAKAAAAKAEGSE